MNHMQTQREAWMWQGMSSAHVGSSLTKFKNKTFSRVSKKAWQAKTETIYHLKPCHRAKRETVNNKSSKVLPLHARLSGVEITSVSDALNLDAIPHLDSLLPQHMTGRTSRHPWKPTLQLTWRESCRCGSHRFLLLSIYLKTK